TGTKLWIREHSDLAVELRTGGEHMSLLTKADGSSFDADSLSMWFAAAIDAAGLPDDVVMHGLRKTAAVMLANGLCGVLGIAAFPGHKSLKEIERYTREANQKKLSSAAILKLEQNVKRTTSGKHISPQGGKRSPRS